VENIRKRLCGVYGSAAVERSTVGRWAKRVTDSERGKAELHDLPRSGPTWHIFGAIKNAVRGVKFKTDDDVISAVRTWLHEQDKEHY
jgi:hypothetical protein